MKVAVIGATGMVGKVMLDVLSERAFPITTLIPAASERSVGKTVDYNGRPIHVVSVATALEMKPDVAIFSAGGSLSKKIAPEFANSRHDGHRQFIGMANGCR